MTIAIPQIVIQVALAMLAVFILPMITPSMMADFSCAGGLLMVATGLRICNIKLFPVANMLPWACFGNAFLPFMGYPSGSEYMTRRVCAGSFIFFRSRHGRGTRHFAG